MPFNPSFLKSYLCLTSANTSPKARDLQNPTFKKVCWQNPLKPIRRTKLVQGELTALSRTRLSPATIKTSTLSAQRIFSSFSNTFQRSAARTATQNQSLLSCTVFITSTRNYAKKKNMPPKKGVEEKKVLLGRPGNNLKSGIV